MSASNSRARRAAAVSVVTNGLPGAAGEDDDAPFLQMTAGAAADVRLGHHLHADRGEQARLAIETFESVLER
jgi:hypothetical protein